MNITQSSSVDGITHFTCAGLHVAMHEEWQKLLLNGRAITLTPTEYRLCMVFFQQWQRSKKKPVMHEHGWIILTYLHITELQRKMSLASKQLLRKHISNTNGKLAPFDVHIKAFEQGYIFLLRSTTQD